MKTECSLLTIQLILLSSCMCCFPAGGTEDPPSTMQGRATDAAVHASGAGQASGHSDSFGWKTSVVPAKEKPVSPGDEEWPIVELEEIRWQLLPNDVRTVYVGPEDRVWYQFAKYRGARSIPEVRQLIADQFKAESPHLTGVRPALFERDGKAVWFLTNDEKTLLRYDGKEWLEHQSSAGRSFVGVCPGHGQIYSQTANLPCDGILFFPDSRGVHVFDGRQWQYQEVFPNLAESAGRSGYKHRAGQYLKLHLEGDGKGVVATAPGYPPNVWRWRDDEWRNIVIDSDYVQDVIPAGIDGLWLLTENDALELRPYDRLPVKERFEGLLKELKSSRDKKEQALVADRMIGIGIEIDPLVQKALEKTYNHAELKQLVRVRRELRGPRATRIGGYRFDRLLGRNLKGLNGSYVFLAMGAQRNDENLGDGLLVLHSDGAVNFSPLQGNQERHCFSSSNNLLVGPSDQKIWVDGAGLEQTAFLFDVGQGAIVEKVPAPGFRWLHAVRRDGTIFVGMREPPNSYTDYVGVYRPGKPETRRMLKWRSFLLEPKANRIGVDSAGGVWANLRNRGIQRFSLGEWTTVQGFEDKYFLHFLAGGNERVILWDHNTCYYFSEGKMEGEYPDIKTLAIDHGDDIAANFSIRLRNGVSLRENHMIALPLVDLVAGGSGEIWLREGLKVSVLLNGEWRPAERALMEAGLHKGSVAALGVFEEDPKVYADGYNRGGLFSLSVIGEDISCSRVNRPRDLRTFRTDSDFEWGAGFDSHDPVFIDHAGNTWLRRGEVYEVKRGEEVVDRLHIPGSQDKGTIGSYEEGSVYINTRVGLYHLTASKESGFKDYEIQEICGSEELPAVSDRFMVTEKGYGVMKVWDPLTGNLSTLCITDLVKKK